MKFFSLLFLAGLSAHLIGRPFCFFLGEIPLVFLPQKFSCRLFKIPRADNRLGMFLLGVIKTGINQEFL